MEIYNQIDIKLTRPGAKVPTLATDGSSGFDIYSPHHMRLGPDEVNIIDTGISIFMNQGNLGAIILPRSSSGIKGIQIRNTVGLLDADYQGEIKLHLWNTKLDITYDIRPGDKVAQIVFFPIIKPTFNVVDEFQEITERGEGGFGSSGH